MRKIIDDGGCQVKIINLDRVEKTRPTMEGAHGIFKQVPISKSDGSPNFSVRVFTIEPEGNTPYHSHDFEHINYIIDGEGIVVNESGAETSIKKGSFALILPNEKHQYKNPSRKAPLVMICAVPIAYE